MPILSVEKISRSFGGVRALSEVSFTVHEGQIKALIGPNGAGKTTLFNLVSGIDRPDAGRIMYRQRGTDPGAGPDPILDLAGRPAHLVSRLGVARTFQHSKVFDDMSVLENVQVGRHAKGRTGVVAAFLSLSRHRKEEKESAEAALHALHLVGLEERAGEPAEGLPLGDRHLLEIARALATEPNLLLLDEPAAGLNREETDRLSDTVRRIRDGGTTVLLVEHDMGFVMEISDEVVVLDYGEKIAEGPPLLIRTDPEVIRAYLGEDLDENALAGSESRSDA